jgi:apolipoprotein N-acyltransferase
MFFALSWPETGGITFLIFFAFVPLLILEKQISEDTRKYRPGRLFLYSYLAFFTWNLISTWWVKNASFGGAAMAIVFNSLFMAVVFQIFHRIKRRIGGRFALIILSSLWMAFEYLHLRWDLTWPWLTLGNVFANRPWTIQWYEYTGVFGGTLWIFISNAWLFSILSKWRAAGNKSKIQSLLMYSLLIVLPLIASYILGPVNEASITTQGKSAEIVIVQPNIDPYNEKFSGSFKVQLTKMLELAETKIDSNTSCVAFPETALTENLWENDLERTYSIQILRMFVQKHPGLDLLIGATSAYQYQPGEIPSATARKYVDAEEFYDDYNTAVFLSGSAPVQKYHKSKFVPGVERMPFPALFKPLEKLAINLGGTTGSLGDQPERTVLASHQNKLKIAPVICYESVFGEYVNGYVKNGANVIFIITNDGWWGNSPGYRQHLDYASLRAIETRRCIARSANTGTSCFIDEWGHATQKTPWWQAMAIKGKVRLNDRITFYVKYGDYIGKVGVIVALFLISYSIVLRFRRKESS